MERERERERKLRVTSREKAKEDSNLGACAL
jgi:hypothetical protein